MSPSSNAAKKKKTSSVPETSPCTSATTQNGQEPKHHVIEETTTSGLKTATNTKSDKESSPENTEAVSVVDEGVHNELETLLHFINGSSSSPIIDKKKKKSAKKRCAESILLLPPDHPSVAERRWAVFEPPDAFYESLAKVIATKLCQIARADFHQFICAEKLVSDVLYKGLLLQLTPNTNISESTSRSKTKCIPLSNCETVQNIPTQQSPVLVSTSSSSNESFLPSPVYTSCIANPELFNTGVYKQDSSP